MTPISPGMNDEEDVNGEAGKMAMADIMALLDRARGQRLRSKLPQPPEPAEAAAPVPDDATGGGGGDLLAELAALLEQQEKPEREC